MNRLIGEQLTAAQGLTEFILNKTVNGIEQDFVVLKGFAGTGKSFTLNIVLENISASIAVTAPTHKAVRVLKKNAEDPEAYAYGTIHSFFGLKQQVSEKGIVSYKPDLTPAKNRLRIDSHNVLIVDEVSMLDPTLFKAIMDYQLHNKYRLRIIFSGDPIQAPPIGEKLSPAFSPNTLSKYQVHTFILDEPRRQSKENPILELATRIRKDITVDRVLVETRTVGDLGIEHISDDSQIVDMFLGQEFEEDTDYCKVLAWTNETVNKVNKAIRMARLKDANPPLIVQGEFLVVDKPIVRQGITKSEVLFNTSEELHVDSVEVITLKLRDAEYEELFFKVYAARVHSEEKTAIINILHEDSYTLYLSTLVAFKNRALMEPSKYAWAAFYNFQNHFAQVKYNYAVTIHKS